MHENLQNCQKRVSKLQLHKGNSFAPKLKGAKFKGICLIQDNISFTHRNVVNFFIFYVLDTWSRDLNTEIKLGDCLFGAVELTRNAVLFLINMGIVVMLMHLMHLHNFYCQMVNRVILLNSK